MLTVKKTAPSKVFRTENPVALKHLQEWVRDLKQSGDSKRNSYVSQLLQDLYDNQLWLVCNCRPDCSLVEAPALAVAKREKTLFLRNLPSRQEHADSCPLKYSRQASSVENSSQLISNELPQCLNLHTPPDSKVLAFHKHKGAATTYSGQQAGQRQSLLSRTLFTLLEKSGSLESTANYRFFDCLDRIKQTASNYQAVPGLPLDQVISFSPKLIKRDCVKIKNRIDAGQQAAYGLLLGIFHSIELVEEKPALIREPSTQQPDGQVVQLEGKLDTLAARSVSKGPFIALITLAPGKGSGSFVQPQKAVSIPVASKRYPIPVESDLERHIFMTLQSYSEWLTKKGKPGFTIYKPMQDIQTELGSCRPDFIVRGPSGTAVVEVMGMMDNDQYRERKARTHPIMATLGPVVEIQPLSSSEERAREQLTEFKRKVRRLVA